MAARADIYTDRDEWMASVAWSVMLHAAFFGSLFLLGGILTAGSAESWGGTGGAGAMSATLVSNIPLPAPTVETENIVANESKGLSETQPKEEAPAPPTAIPIPDKVKKSKKDTRSTTQTKPAAPPAPNVVPFGQGGPVSGPYGTFSAAGAKGGFGFSGGAGDFGSRYAWYVDVVRRKVSENWLKYEIDPNIVNARRVYIAFDINRQGGIENIRLEQSSGVPSLDTSATRALQRIDSFGALPGDYSGQRVHVEFWFDYRK